VHIRTKQVQPMRSTFLWPRLITAALVLLLSIPALADAQQNQLSGPQSYSPAQLDQMLAPIALYPDALVAQILMAATYPLEVVQADRWIQNPGNAALRGADLESALGQQSWSPSVKSLVPFPQVLRMMDNDLQWTEQLGDAFMAEQNDVMDSVQRLRRQAQGAGNLHSTPQQTVVVEPQNILIEPADPRIVYVPYYNPVAVYGPWRYPAYPPMVFQPVFALFFRAGPFSFSIGLPILAPYWGWEHWDWHRRVIVINDEHYRRINFNRPPPVPGFWRHDPAHRLGVPYRSPAVRAAYQHASDESRRNFRGFAAGSPPLSERPSAMRPGQQQGHSGAPGQPAVQNRQQEQPQQGQRQTQAQHQMQQATQPQRQAPQQQQAQHQALQQRPQQMQQRPQQQMQQQRQAPQQQAQRPVAPLFESYQHGADARGHGSQGEASRKQQPSRAPQQAPSDNNRPSDRSSDRPSDRR
jgi:hypothetical protein